MSAMPLAPTSTPILTGDEARSMRAEFMARLRALLPDVQKHDVWFDYMLSDEAQATVGPSAEVTLTGMVWVVKVRAKEPATGNVFEEIAVDHDVRAAFESVLLRLPRRRADVDRIHQLLAMHGF